MLRFDQSSQPAAAAPLPAAKLFHFAPSGDDQRRAAAAIRASDITFVRGEQGTGKTHVAIGVAAELVLAQKYARVVLVRPLVPAGENVGFLKGDLGEKLDPWVEGFKDCLGSLTFQDPDLFFRQFVDVRALAFMRGRTLDRVVAILDEAQNCTARQLKLFVGRLGRRGKLVIVGDEEQCDAHHRPVLDRAVDLLAGLQVAGDGDAVHRVADVVLTEQCRNPLVREATRRLRNL